MNILEEYVSFISRIEAKFCREKQYEYIDRVVQDWGSEWIYLKNRESRPKYKKQWT